MTSKFQWNYDKTRTNINVLQESAHITTIVNQKGKTELLIQHDSTRFIITRNTKHFK